MMQPLKKKTEFVLKRIRSPLQTKLQQKILTQKLSLQVKIEKKNYFEK